MKCHRPEWDPCMAAPLLYGTNNVISATCSSKASLVPCKTRPTLWPECRSCCPVAPATGIQRVVATLVETSIEGFTQQSQLCPHLLCCCTEVPARQFSRSGVCLHGRQPLPPQLCRDGIMKHVSCIMPLCGLMVAVWCWRCRLACCCVCWQSIHL